MKNIHILSLILLLFVSSVAINAFAEAGRVSDRFTFQNPAEMALVNKAKIVGGVSIGFVHVPFAGQVTTAARGTEAIDTSGSETTYEMPGFLAYVRFTKHIIGGFVFSTPFFTDFDYPQNSPVRYSVVQVRNYSYNLSPNIAFEFSKKLSIGAGVDIQRATIYIRQTAAASPTVDVPFVNLAGDWRVGWHVGAFSQPWLGGMLSLAYYSGIRHDLVGRSIFNTTINPDLRAGIQRPPVYIFKLFQALNKHIGVIFTADYVLWNISQQVNAENTALPGSATVVIPLFYHNVWEYSLGGRFAFKKWVFYTIAGYNSSPINPAYRSLLLPENNFWDMRLALDYYFTKSFSLRLGYKHVFQMRSPINANINNVVTTGTAVPYGDLLHISLSYEI